MAHFGVKDGLQTWRTSLLPLRPVISRNASVPHFSRTCASQIHSCGQLQRQFGAFHQKQQSSGRESLACRSTAVTKTDGSGSSADDNSKDAASAVVKTPEYSPEFKKARFITFIGLWVGYAAFYLTRNSLTYVAPVMLNDPALGLNLSQVGGLTSILPLAYGMSKFLSGVLGSRTSPTVLLAGGLMATALVNIAFGFGNAYVYFCFVWATNGILQGLGAPACARMLTSWFAGKERGKWWAFWTASNNVGGFAAPILAGSAANKLGWRWGMYAPGVVGIILGIILLGVTKDSPESAGFPPVEETAKKTPSGEKKKGPSMMESLTNECLKNPYIWAFAIIYFFVYVVRQGVTSWFIFYLLKAKGVQDSATAAVRVSGLELGGLVGSLAAGTLSDKMVARASENGSGMVGARVKVVMVFSAATVAALAAFWACPNVAWMQWGCVALVGVALYGPQMLIGLCGAEVVSPPSVSACQGFLGWIAYLGAAGAGAPLAMIVQKFGWNALFTTLIGAAGINLLLLAPMMNLKSYPQQEAAGKVA